MTETIHMSADGGIPKQFILGLYRKLIVDLFAGGGGMSKAIDIVFGRHADIACNHDDNALSMHRVNHPQTRHFQCDVREVDPRTVCRDQPVGLLHLSPDCTHHSQAAGGQPRDRKIRALSWIAIRWAGTVRPEVITLENVKQIRKWGPLVAKRDPNTGRVLKLDGSIAAKGERVPLEQQYLIPDKRHEGRTWSRFKATLNKMGYLGAEAILVAANHGAGTTRERLMYTARCDGLPIGTAATTHRRNPAPGQKGWTPAVDFIDFSVPCPSIFDRKRPLADASLRRTAVGISRYVLKAAEPFIIPATHHGSDRLRPTSDPLPTITAAHRGELMLVAPHLQQITQGGRTRSAGEPHPTVTTAKGGEQALVAPSLIQVGYGEREGQAPRCLDIGKPLGTIVGAGKHAITAAWLVQQNTMPNGGVHPGHDLRGPASTFTGTGSQQAFATANLITLRRNCDGKGVDEPLRTLAANGEHHAMVRCALMTKYYGTGGQWQAVDHPAHTLTSKARMGLVTGDLEAVPLTAEQFIRAKAVADLLRKYGLWDDREVVTVMIRGILYVIADIGLRMLLPREAYGCQGFPPDYIIDRGHDGRIFSKAAQFKMCGNSVSPPMGVAHLLAQFPERVLNERRQAA